MIEIGIIKGTPQDKISDIRDSKDVIKARYAIDSKDALVRKLMGDHHIALSFNLNRYVEFNASDYIVWEGEKYTLQTDIIPEQSNKHKYTYTLQFDAKEILFTNIQYYYLNLGIKQVYWGLTGNASFFLKVAIDNINRYFGGDDFNIGDVEPTEIKYIKFSSGVNVFDALTDIAEQFDAEWHITGKTIHLVKNVAYGDAVDFEVDVSVLGMRRSDGDKDKKYTRLLALGSTRNIPSGYRDQRLRIPLDKGDVIDARPSMTTEEVVEGTAIFEHIYPKRVGTIEAIGTIEYVDKDEETGETTKWLAYKFKDLGIDFKDEYIIPGQTLRLHFESGDLGGLDFDLIFHKNGFSETDNSQHYEIVRSEDYGQALPHDIMKPKVGDNYVLYNFDISLVSDQYVPLAEKELYNEAAEWQKRQFRDTSVYECPAVVNYAVANSMDLEIGQRANLIHERFGSQGRLSRIMGYEKPLINIYAATYTVGDNPAYSRRAALEDRIKELEYGGLSFENIGGSGVYVIKQFDSTRPTDHNVYSAKASNAMYLNKQTGGTVQGDTTFAKNMQVQGSTISDVFQNSTFSAGQLGSGFQIKRDANGQSYMEVDNILVRREAVFNRLTIAEIKSVGGTILLSLANMQVLAVEEKASTWKCFFDTDNLTIPNDFAINDQVICRKWTGKNIKYYWSLVTAVGDDFIELSKTDKDGSGVPASFDEIVQLGNRTDVNRQYAIMLSAYGSSAPSINQYAGINSYDLTGKEVTVISPKGNVFSGDLRVSTNGTTAPVYKERSVFANGTTYYLNDRVSYLGSHWVCIVNTTITTPNETSVTWRKETAGQADIDKAANQVRTEYKADFVVLDTKIASKVSQTDFNALGSRVSTTESSIIQLSDRITSTVEKVDNIQIGSRNFLLNSSDYSSLWKRKTIGETITNEYYNGSKIVELRSAWGGIGYIGKNIEEKPYIYSFYAKINEVDTTLDGNLICYGTTANPFVVPIKTLTKEWKRYSVIITPKFSDASGIRIEPSVVKAGKVISICGFKLEEGNKATAWTPAPEDVQAGIDNAQSAAANAQSTADSKNRSYYQDPVPAAPSGGHKIGDVWYKTSLVDSSGNVNADTSKNIYQLQYRWDGSVWRQINWSVSKSKIEQTDSSISMIVEKTGINSVGTGSTLYSLINQTADEIRLEVSSIQVGSRNLFLDSAKFGSPYWVSRANITLLNEYYRECRIYRTANPWSAMTYRNYDNINLSKEHVFSFYAKSNIDLSSQSGDLFSYGIAQSQVIMPINKITTEWQRVSIKGIPTGDVNGIRAELNSSIPGGYVYFCGFKLEEGNKATDWTPAIEDTQAQIDGKTTLDEVKAGLKITADGIEVFGETFKVSSLLIAKAIEAESLNVGGNMTIGRDGMLSIAGGKVLLRPDGSGQLANGNIKWDAQGNVSVQGKFESSFGANRVMIDPVSNELQFYIKNKLAGRMYAYTDNSFGATAAFESTVTINGNEYKSIYMAGLIKGFLNGEESYSISNAAGKLGIKGNLWNSTSVPTDWYVENGYVKIR